MITTLTRVALEDLEAQLRDVAEREHMTAEDTDKLIQMGRAMLAGMHLGVSIERQRTNADGD